VRDDGWARLYSQPAVITSTVDQQDSRLLCRGYGGRSALTALIFAGLAVHESLIQLDEAHRSVPFLQTLRAVECYRGADWTEQTIRRPFAFSILSATPPSDIPKASIFPGMDRDAAFDHPALARHIHVGRGGGAWEQSPARAASRSAQAQTSRSTFLRREQHKHHESAHTDQSLAES